jgi:hypothetical protein
MSLRHLLSRWFGERITLTVAPAEFIISVRDDDFAVMQPRALSHHYIASGAV